MTEQEVHWTIHYWDNEHLFVGRTKTHKAFDDYVRFSLDGYRAGRPHFETLVNNKSKFLKSLRALGYRTGGQGMYAWIERG